MEAYLLVYGFLFFCHGPNGGLKGMAQCNPLKYATAVASYFTIAIKLSHFCAS